MTEAVSSFIDNIKQKSTNPFFGTLILVYLIRNWELIYTLFIFDDECTMNDKKHYIYNYIHVHSNDLNIFYNAGIALLAYLIGLLALTFSRFIVDWKDYKLTPWLNKKAISNLVANKEDLDKMTQERDIFLDDLIKERERFSSVELDNKKLREDISKRAKSYNDLNKSYQELQDTYHKSNIKIDGIEKELKKLHNITNERDALIKTRGKLASLKSFQTKEIIKVEDIKDSKQDSRNFDFAELSKSKLINTFIGVCEQLMSEELNDEFLLDNFSTSQLESLGLIRRIEKGIDYTNFNTYITGRGIHLYNFLKRNKIYGKD